MGPPRWPGGKEFACHCRRLGFDPWIRKIPWRRKWQPTSVFLPGKSHGQRSLAGYSSWGRKDLDATELLSTHESSSGWAFMLLRGHWDCFKCKLAFPCGRSSPPLTLVREAFEPTNEVILFLHLVKEQLMALVLRLVTHATSQTRD